MTRILAIGAGDAEALASALAALGLATVRTAAEFRELVELMPGAMAVPAPCLPPCLPPAPKFGSNRPYLKKKKGRS